MKPIYKSLALANMALAITLSLQANVTSDGTSTPQAVNAETLEGLKVTLVSPNVSGARDLVASGECVINNDKLQILLDGSQLTKGATYWILVQMEYGTNTVVLYALDVKVPYYATLASDIQEYADNVVVVETFGDGDTSGADASVYAKNGDGNAHITKPLSVGDGIAGGDGAVASGYTVGVGSYIEAGNAGAVASGYTDGDNSYIEAGGVGAVASGATTSTSGDVIASGGASHAFGIGVQATQEAQIVVGQCNVVDEDDTFQFVVGNGADDEHRSNAFGVTKSGSLALFKADGTPIYLDAAKLEALIAMLPSA